MGIPTRTEILEQYGDVSVTAGTLRLPLARIVDAERLCPVPVAERDPAADACYLLGKVAGSGFPLLPEHTAFLEQVAPAS